MTVSAWEAFFFIVVLKIPLIYLAIVVWWAVRAVPDQPGGGDGATVVALTPCGWNDWKRTRSRRIGPRRPIGPSLRRARMALR